MTGAIGRRRESARWQFRGGRSIPPTVLDARRRPRRIFSIRVGTVRLLRIHYTHGVPHFRGRPDFMTWTFALAFVVTSTAGLVTETLFRKEASAGTLSPCSEALVSAQLVQRGWTPIATRARIERLRAKQGVELLAATRPFALTLASGTLSGSRPPAELGLNAIADVVATELERYPSSFLRSIHFRRVLLCSRLREGARKIPSLPNFEETLVLEASSSSDFLRRLVHHEVFHFADFAEDEQVLRDAEWERLNDHFFVYGDGGRNMRAPDASRFRDDLPGFVTAYSTSGLEEDKAEIFAFLMTEPSRMVQVAERDPIVAAKVRRLKATLARRFAIIDDRFWAAQNDG